MKIETPFSIGEIVFLITDEYQVSRIITGITVRGNSSISYELSCGPNASWHYDFEMASEKNLVTKFE